jgi:hypothetical protein
MSVLALSMGVALSKRRILYRPNSPDQLQASVHKYTQLSILFSPLTTSSRLLPFL